MYDTNNNPDNISISPIFLLNITTITSFFTEYHVSPGSPISLYHLDFRGISPYHPKKRPTSPYHYPLGGGLIKSIYPALPAFLWRFSFLKTTRHDWGHVLLADFVMTGKVSHWLSPDWGIVLLILPWLRGWGYPCWNNIQKSVPYKVYRVTFLVTSLAYLSSSFLLSYPCEANSVPGTMSYLAGIPATKLFLSAVLTQGISLIENPEIFSQRRKWKWSCIYSNPADVLPRGSISL